MRTLVSVSPDSAKPSSGPAMPSPPPLSVRAFRPHSCNHQSGPPGVMEPASAPNTNGQNERAIPMCPRPDRGRHPRHRKACRRPSNMQLAAARGIARNSRAAYPPRNPSGSHEGPGVHGRDLGGLVVAKSDECQSPAAALRPWPQACPAPPANGALISAGDHEPAASTTSASNTRVLRPTLSANTAWRRSTAARSPAKKAGSRAAACAVWATPNATCRASSRRGPSG